MTSNRDQFPAGSPTKSAGLERPFVSRAPAEFASSPRGSGGARPRPYRVGGASVDGVATPEELRPSMDARPGGVVLDEAVGAGEVVHSSESESPRRADLREFSWGQTAEGATVASSSDLSGAAAGRAVVLDPGADSATFSGQAPSPEGSRYQEESPAALPEAVADRVPTADEMAVADTLEALARAVRAGRVHEFLATHPRDTLAALVVGYVSATFRPSADGSR